MLPDDLLEMAECQKDDLKRRIREFEDERDQLRAELTAAKNLLARIHRDGGHHTEAVGFAQSVADAGDKVSEWLLAAEERDRQYEYNAGAIAKFAALESERDQLAAHVERLRNALEWSKSYWPEQEESRHSVDCCCPVCDVNACIEEAEAALAATPAQSLAAHDAAVKVAVLREVAGEIKQLIQAGAGAISVGRNGGIADVFQLISAKADRIAKEVASK